MAVETPQRTRVYQNHHLDSTRWDLYEPREGDVIVTTSYKAGTTWTQQILYQFFHGRKQKPPPFDEVTPWPDARFRPPPREELAAALEALESPRILKSHLPLDGLPYYPEVRYLVVARDPRDVFMSFYNHYSGYTELAMSLMNAPDIVGDPLPRCPEDPRELWQSWITRGWFEWESEGYPFWANLGHTGSYWPFRALPNFHFLHYADMLEDLPAAVREIADFVGVDLSEEDHARAVEATTFENAKAKAVAAETASGLKSRIFEGGADRFFFKGTNGRWKGVLNDADLELYEAAKRRVLTPDCARWLEEGGAVG